MHKLMLFLILMISFGAASAGSALAGCNPFGVSTLRGDAVYPPEWLGRDIIGIMPPEEYVFGVVDGAVLPQQFTQIKAKLTNLVSSVPLHSGTLKAVAGYRLRTDYQPDMSTDPITVIQTIPPRATNVEENFSFSQSKPIAIDLLPSDAYEQFTFDFSAEPIPAGVVDLFLQIYFHGYAGDNQRQAIVLSTIIDLSEPMHVTLWNLFDHILYFDTLREFYSVRVEEFKRMYDECGIVRYASICVHFYMGFSEVESEPVKPVVYVENMLMDHHSRLIVLAPPGPMRIRTYMTGGLNRNYWEWKADNYEDWLSSWGNLENYDTFDNLYGGVVNQQNNQGFVTTEPITIRNIKSHFPDFFLLSCPTYLRSEINAFYENLPTPNPDPVPLKVLE